MQKPVIAPQSRQQIFDYICEFFAKKVTPNNYMPTDKAETKMQIHFSQYMSDRYDVLREVPIPKCCNIEGCGEETWEIDESLRIPTTGRTFYIAGELKFHGQKMAERDFVGDAKKDIKRMLCVYQKYIDVTMTFTAFVTCDEKERDDLYQFAVRLNGVKANKLTCPDDGYYAVVIRIDFDTTIIPQAPQYAEHWNDWLKSVIANNKDNHYFPKKRIQMW